jgi:hypothetical protein
MDKRYQVFVSSTFSDLQEERQEVMQALLELDCIPSGMELFPAANEDQWTLIKKVIDDCDYYIVIIAGRYGSTGPDATSYTEMEYRYALERSTPTIGFLHKNPGSIRAELTESDPTKREKLEQFRKLVEQKACRYWENPADLGSKVSRSLVRLINSTPAIGWVRADQAGENATAEILRLRKQVEELEAKIQAARETAPPGTENLAQGDDLLEISFTVITTKPKKHEFFETKEETRYRERFTASWNDIFAAVAPLMIDEARDNILTDGLTKFVAERNLTRLRKGLPENENIDRIQVYDKDSQTIKVQLRALGLIAMSRRTRSVKDTGTYWTLTPYGDAVMTRLRAIARNIAG